MKKFKRLSADQDNKVVNIICDEVDYNNPTIPDCYNRIYDIVEEELSQATTSIYERIKKLED
jgi:septation ring formation regulator EzrA